MNICTSSTLASHEAFDFQGAEDVFSAVIDDVKEKLQVKMKGIEIVLQPTKQFFIKNDRKVIVQVVDIFVAENHFDEARSSHCIESLC